MANFAKKYFFMLVILGVMALGIAVGYCLRHREIRLLDSVTVVIIWALLFLLGLEAGNDERIVRWIGSLGLEAFVISCAAVGGSSLFACLLWRYAKRKEGAE